ncbi:hypothetical protein QA312_02095 [Glaesserella parasuis]|uniref:hypothetical protein n=1 Tax=Glaesserella parasuis TaxID=738 RepID=UPI0018C93F34|nr:hypothetical protein [Glaesserella parasuis]MDG6822747.1 hypothetical protein [Glaesserella parasuis]QPN19611.1 hypothetical protein I5Z97_03610 [Glaesserella parasuis]
MEEKEYINLIEEPKVDFSCFDSKSREDGISGFMRLRNEGEFLSLAIESWLPILDELIIVYNNCQDNTEEIALRYARLYPEKIKVFHYLPIVYPQGSQKYKELASSDFHSLVNYYNFALSKTTKKWAIKIDGDQILYKGSVIRQKYEELRLNKPNHIQLLSGVNLIDNYGKLYVPSSARFCNFYGDLWLFRVDKDTIFKKGQEWEYLDLSNRTYVDTIFVHYHLKFMKNDYGIGNYELDENPNSRYYPLYLVFLIMLRLIPLEKIAKETSMPIIDCEDLSIQRSRYYRKEAWDYLNQKNASFSFSRFIKEFYIYLRVHTKLRVVVNILIRVLRPLKKVIDKSKL